MRLIFYVFTFPQQLLMCIYPCGKNFSIFISYYLFITEEEPLYLQISRKYTFYLLTYLLTYLLISSFSCAMCLKFKKSPLITIAKKGIFWWGISNFNVVYWIASHLTKFCHYSSKSINSNFCEKLTFFWQKFKLVLYVYCAAFATIVRQSKGLFYNFMFFQIS